jgi:DNA-binding NarL/FixJ family response regulator
LSQEPEERSAIKVFLVGASDFVQTRITSLISSVPGIDIVGSARNPLTAITQIKTLKPDVVILDMRLQKWFGVDLLQNIGEMMPLPATIVVATHIFGRYPREVKIKPDIMLDKFTDWNKIPEILKCIFPRGNPLISADSPANQ